MTHAPTGNCAASSQVRGEATDPTPPRATPSDQDKPGHMKHRGSHGICCFVGCISILRTRGQTLAARTCDLTSHQAHGSASATWQIGCGARTSQTMAKASATTATNACTNLRATSLPLAIRGNPLASTWLHSCSLRTHLHEGCHLLPAPTVDDSQSNGSASRHARNRFL
jgi:hypothetical protein